MKTMLALLAASALVVAAGPAEAKKDGYPNGRGWQTVNGDFEEVKEKVDGVQATADEINEGVASVQETLSEPLNVNATVVNDSSSPVPVTVLNQVTPPSTVTIGNDAMTPVPVINVNEPGREPYNEYIEYGSSGCSINCTDFASFGSVLLFNGPPVPPGKRLVVQWVSGTVPSDTQFNVISFQQQTIIVNQFGLWNYYGPFQATSAAGTVWGMSSEAFFTVEPDEPLRVRVQIGSATNFIAGISVSGYLIDAE